MDEVRPVDLLAHGERDAVLAVELLQRVQADGHVVQAAEHDESLPQAVRSPLLENGRTTKDALHWLRDAPEAVALVLEDLEPVASSHKLVQDEADCRVGHAQLLGNVLLAALDLPEVRQRAVPVHHNSLKVVEGTSKVGTLQDGIARLNSWPRLATPGDRTDPEVVESQELLATQAAPPKEALADLLELRLPLGYGLDHGPLQKITDE